MVARSCYLSFALLTACSTLVGSVTGYDEGESGEPQGGNAEGPAQSSEPVQPPQPEEPVAAPVTHDGLSANGLSSNRLSLNRLSLNALSTDRLTLNGEGLEATPEGRELLTYLVRCALPEGESLGVSVNSIFYVFPGSLGFAPEWRDDECDESCQRWVSGCLLAHVNALGVAVPISVRTPNDMIETSAVELSEYALQEGAFWGDIFVEEGEAMVMNSCEGWGLSGSGGGNNNNGNGDLSDDPTSWLSKRLCAEDDVCGFATGGPCGDAQWGNRACEASMGVGEAYVGCKTSQQGAPVYQEVVTIYVPQ